MKIHIKNDDYRATKFKLQQHFEFKKVFKIEYKLNLIRLISLFVFKFNK